MFRPNLRGVARANLRLGFSGWQDATTGQLIEHRWPLREHWVTRLAKNAHLQPVLSRSGQVYLIRSFDVPKVKHESMEKGMPLVVDSAPKTRTSANNKILFATAVASCVGISIWLLGSGALPTQMQLTQKALIQKTLTQKTQNPEPADECAQNLASPESALNNWLNGKASATYQITEISRFDLGGIQSRTVQLDCGAESQKINLSLIKHGDVWELNKFARLEN